MTNVSRLLLSVAMLGGGAVPAFAQGAAPAVSHHRVTRVHHMAAAHDIGGAAKPTPVVKPAIASPAAAKAN